MLRPEESPCSCQYFGCSSGTWPVVAGPEPAGDLTRETEEATIPIVREVLVVGFWTANIENVVIIAVVSIDL